MSVVRLGATKQYSDNWENIFSGGKRSPSAKKSAAKPAQVAEESGQGRQKSRGQETRQRLETQT